MQQLVKGRCRIRMVYTQVKKHKRIEKLVSVLMCVHDTPIDYLKEAVSSILDQTYKNIELVIIDDCSKNDSVLAYLSEIDDKYKQVHIYRNNYNLGLTKSLNIGINLCKGRYIARQDSDDISKKNRIEEQLKTITREEVVLIGSNWKVFPLKKVHPLYISSDKGYEVAMIFGNQGPCHSTFFIDKEELKSRNLSYDENYRTAQDYALLCDVLCSEGKVGLCRNTLVGWREHQGQISNTKKIQQNSDADAIRCSFLQRKFHLEEDEAVDFVKNIGEYTYRDSEDCTFVQKMIDIFLNKNISRIADGEVHKYWFRQSIKRCIEIKKGDFIKTKLFYECFRPDRFCYIVFHNIMERIHYLYQPFVKI